MIKVVPCINFDGCCEQAINLYTKAFGGKTQLLIRYKDKEKGEWEAPITEEQGEKIYHCEFFIGESCLILADDIYAVSRKTTLQFNTIVFNTKQQVESAYKALALEGVILSHLENTSESTCMGSVIDKFGIRWGLMAEQVDE